MVGQWRRATVHHPMVYISTNDAIRKVVAGTREMIESKIGQPSQRLAPEKGARRMLLIPPRLRDFANAVKTDLPNCTPTSNTHGDVICMNTPKSCLRHIRTSGTVAESCGPLLRRSRRRPSGVRGVVGVSRATLRVGQRSSGCAQIWTRCDPRANRVGTMPPKDAQRDARLPATTATRRCLFLGGGANIWAETRNFDGTVG